jgi:AcrR family transcriptional regulator
LAGATAQPGLRERKKLRTRQTIVDVATRLFVGQGYQQTTLAQIAEAAEVSTSTFFNYFPTKADIVFSFMDSVVDSAHRRIAERPVGEPAGEAITAWLTEELASVEQPYARAIRAFRQIVGSDPELVAEERLRLALLEDVLAAGFARDLDESPDGLRSRVLASIAVRGMQEAWAAWLDKHATDADFQLGRALEAKAAYVEQVLERALAFVDLLPRPPDV